MEECPADCQAGTRRECQILMKKVWSPVLVTECLPGRQFQHQHNDDYGDDDDDDDVEDEESEDEGAFYILIIHILNIHI